MLSAAAALRDVGGAGDVAKLGPLIVYNLKQPHPNARRGDPNMPSQF